MKVLIVSDNHGDLASLEELINIYENEIDLWLHCGDSEFNASHPIWDTFKTVTGNMDRDPNLLDYRVETYEDETFLIVHGHRQQVRMTLEPMAELARENNAQIVFYGHTHVAQVDQIDGLYFINPGSIVQPRGSLRVGTYAIYEKKNQEEMITYYDWNHNKVEELSQKLN